MRTLRDMTEDEEFDAEEAEIEGRAMGLLRCYVCYTKQTGKIDEDSRAASVFHGKGPLRGIKREGLTPPHPDPRSFDATATYELVPCGHVII
jgi:hypothetical protein